MIKNDNIIKITNIINSLNKEEIIWLNGYLAALMPQDKVITLKPEIALTIIYVSETGNAKFLATRLNNELKKLNFKTNLKDVSDYRVVNLAKEDNLILISSTHGDGEIPDSGKDFYEKIKQQKSLNNLNFLGIGLGDSSYPLFCEAIKKFSKALTNKGANLLTAEILLDLDFEDNFELIKQQITANFSSKVTEPSVEIISNKTEITGIVGANINLNDLASTKQTHHIEIICDHKINYQPGDSVAILLDNKELEIDSKIKITPRQYSICSAPEIHDNEIHLCVSLVKYLDDKKVEKFGLFSRYLTNLKEGDKIKFKITPNRNFRLPKDQNANIIMAGAGTGIAPFRSFLHQRSSNNANSKSWLFFGARNFQTDFLYQLELQEFLASKNLSKIDLAFSRDQEQKIYIQHLIKNNSKELFSWLQEGAYFYLCGDKKHMAKDVEQALLEVIKENSTQNPQQYLDKLIKEGRYLKDVY